MRDKLVYLASPYHHDNYYVMKARYEDTARACYYLLRNGFNVVSPICHWHPMKIVAGSFDAVDDDLIRTNTHLLTACDAIWVVMFNGWKGSAGVSEEIALARKLGKEVRYFTYQELVAITLKEEENE